MKKSIKFIFALLLVFSLKAYAETSISEYTSVPHGMLLENNNENNNSENVFNTNFVNNRNHVFLYSLEKILEMFNNKQYIEIKDEVTKQAEQNVIIAAKILGIMYRHGLGMDVNYNEALKWLTKAADAEDPEAQQQLAMMYFKGEGINKDISEALKWLKIASLLTDDDILKEDILKDYKKVLIASNRRQKTFAAEKIEKWAKDNNKMNLLKDNNIE